MGFALSFDVNELMCCSGASKTGSNRVVTSKRDRGGEQILLRVVLQLFS